MIPKPYRTAVHADGSVYYEFKGLDNDKNGKYYVRGAVAWPMLNDQTGISEGFIICAAQHIDSGTLIVFESGPFRCIEHILDKDGKIEYEGISTWFNAVWSHYNCNLFYRSDSDDTHRIYLKQILRSTMIKPTPGFPELKITDRDDAINVLFAWRTKNQIVMDEDSKLHSDVLLWENTGRKLQMPGVNAVLTLVNGFERYKFQPRSEE